MAPGQKPKNEDAPEPAKAAKDAVADTDTDEDALTFPVERLTGPEALVLTGYEGPDVVGALHGVSKKNLTIEEVQAAVKAWLESPVKED